MLYKQFLKFYEKISNPIGNRKRTLKRLYVHIISKTEKSEACKFKYHHLCTFNVKNAIFQIVKNVKFYKTQIWRVCREKLSYTEDGSV